MDVSFVCPDCQSKLKFDAASYPPGTEVDCPNCRANLTIPRPNIGPGVTIGGFELKKLLGKGGMGEVYLARQLSMDRDVAVKILPSSFSLKEENIRRFRQEVAMAAKLKHANIVRALEAGEDAGVHFLAMDLVEGEGIHQRLEKRGPFSEADARKLLEKLVRALDHIWTRHEMVHRDIKPANIMLDEEDEPMLMDLGLGKVVGEEHGVTVSSALMGTPNYMSPEQVMGEKNLDFRTDMYCLGVTLYHLLTDRVPFRGKNVMDVLHKQTTESLPDVREVRPEISEAMAEMIERMTAKRPDDRYSSWSELLTDLESVEGESETGLPVARQVAQPGDDSETAESKTGPNRRLLAIAGLAVVLGLGLWLVSTMMKHRDSAIAPVVDEGLLGWWNFEEGHGTKLADTSGHDHPTVFDGRSVDDIWVADAPPVAHAGKGSLRFQQRNQLVQISFDPPRPIEQQVTVCGWVKIYPVTTTEGLLRSVVRGGRPSKRKGRYGGQARIRLSIIGHFELESESGIISTLPMQPANVPREQWYHILGCYDGEAMRVFMNGNEVTRKQWGSKVDFDLEHISLGHIGGVPARSDFAFDDVRIYNRALTLEEIKLLAAKTK